MDLTKFMAQTIDVEAVQVSRILKAAGDAVRRNTAALKHLAFSLMRRVMGSNNASVLSGRK